jgi:hypothetical protein
MAITDVLYSAGGSIPGADLWNSGGGTTSTIELFVKVFSGEVLTAFDRAIKVRPLVTTRTITQGKSATFPLIGRAFAKYHTRGMNVLDNTTNDLLSPMEHNEALIHVDRKLIAATFVDSLDELMNHYDLRGPYAKELGGALARKIDEQLLALCAEGARAAAQISNESGEGGHESGSVVFNSAGQIDTVAEFLKALRVAQIAMDTKNVPDEGRFCCTSPGIYSQLLSDGAVASMSPMNADILGATGNLARGSVTQLYGFNIFKSNSFQGETKMGAQDGSQLTDTTNVIDATGNDYTPDLDDTIALCWHGSGLGDLMLRGVSMELDYRVERQGTLMLSKIMGGRNWLRPAACLEISSHTAIPAGADAAVAFDIAAY